MAQLIGTPIHDTGASTGNANGFDGLGSSFAPSLVESLKTLSYADFTNIVVGGRKDVNTANEKVMPSCGTDRNVMCYLDDIYVYLRARSDGKLRGGRPEKHVDRSSCESGDGLHRSLAQLIAWAVRPLIPLGVLGLAPCHDHREAHCARNHLRLRQ